MESRDSGYLRRSVSAVSTASVWTERTLVGMGLSREHTASNNRTANANVETSETLPLRHWRALGPELDNDQNHEEHINATEDRDRGNVITKTHTSKSINLLTIWWLEAASCLLVVAMIVALVGTICPYQDRPLPRWPSILSINSVFAFYSEVMRAAMILVLGECLSQLKWSWFAKQPRPLGHLEHYDNASRGLWGSFELLWAIRLRALLPSIGGIMMILSLLLVPFTQQILRFYSCSVLDTSRNASIPTTHFASAGLSFHVGAGLNAIKPAVQAQLSSGIYDTNPKQVSFNCPTGNCTFDGLYHSAGWCSHCDDVSNQLEIYPSDISSMNYTLPSTNLTAVPGIYTFVMAGESPIQAILGFGQNLSNTPWGVRGYGAAECTISPCVRSYTSTVEGGNFTETLVSTSQTWSDGLYWLSSIDVPCLTTTEKQALHTAGYQFDSEKTQWLAYNLSVYAEDAFNPTILNETNTTIRPECIYQTDHGHSESLNFFLNSMFTGTVAFAVEVIGGPPILQAIFQEGNVTFSTIDDAFSRLAQALTVWTREDSGQNVTGQIFQSETCVGARWAWLAYPLAMVLGMMVFLIWTIDHTRRNEGSRQDYKSSPLALLFHPLGTSGSEGSVSSIASRSELERKAKSMKVMFQGADEVWRFIETDQPSNPKVR
ncbi:uncharacterized protein F4822DRAFT_446033 [Hypoxylon trugodes]|uniref:uncharacterized protein n=1 Tax=Hypoxylon trugodes TaxID=326681 RepID=UPI00219A42A6|nr:uncharacterized protein F4822DRAFT_446033 [Hypoxylon trugodes]KAI1384856.1 hypothetical protein F4822DRAFT_446033 [Hypoxylon trugodes]